MLVQCFAAVLSIASIETSAKQVPVGRLFQVIVNVRDMRKELTFWRDVMGLVVVYPRTSSDFFQETFVRLDAGGTSLVLHAGRTSQNAREEPRLSFMVDDLARTRDRLIANGVRLSEIRSPAPGVRVIDGRDPEGNVFHLESHGK